MYGYKQHVNADFYLTSLKGPLTPLRLSCTAFDGQVGCQEPVVK